MAQFMHSHQEEVIACREGHRRCPGHPLGVSQSVPYSVYQALSISPAPALLLDFRDTEKSNTTFAYIPLGAEGDMQKLRQLHSIKALGYFNRCTKNENFFLWY